LSADQGSEHPKDSRRPKEAAKMADTEHGKSDCHWVAIDVARYWNAVLIETISGDRHRFRMANSAEDFDRLIEFLRKLGGRCHAALEPTGDYHRPIAYRLLQAGVEVSGISSVAQSRYREAFRAGHMPVYPKSRPSSPDVSGAAIGNVATFSFGIKVRHPPAVRLPDFVISASHCAIPWRPVLPPSLVTGWLSRPTASSGFPRRARFP
jgi:hypothetical protein